MSDPVPPAIGHAADALARAYLAETTRGLVALRRQAADALAQLPDDMLWTPLDPESNSAGVIVRHMAGNLRSRFTDFLATDGEKPTRDRDDEFVGHPELGRAALMAEWAAGWACIEGSVAALAPAQLLDSVVIRGEPLTVLEALERAVRHAAGHVGQLVLLAKHHAGPAWRTLSIPRGQSAAYEAEHRRRFAPSMTGRPAADQPTAN